MRKYLILALLLVGVASSAYAYDDPTFGGWTNKSAFSQQRSQGTPVRVLKLVRNGAIGANTTTILSKDAVVYDTVSDDGITVGLTTASGDNAFAGIAVTTILSSDQSDTVTGNTAVQDAGRRNWGWIIVHGPAWAKVSAGGTNAQAAGDMFITSVDSGTITGLKTVINGLSVGPGEVKRGAGGHGGFFYNAANETSTAVQVQVENE